MGRRMLGAHVDVEELALQGPGHVVFTAHGLVASWLAVVGPPERWALYTGLIAYLLVGALFSAEFVYRQWRFRRYLGAPTDALFRRIFPPRSS